MTMIRSRVSPVMAGLLAICVSLGHCIAEEANTTASVAKHHEEPKAVPWNRLAPENGKPFNDPFTKLTSEQLADVSYVVRVRRLIAEEKIEADGVDAKAADTLTRKLKAEGVDIGWLMQQRERVRQIRGLQVDAFSKSVAKSLKSELVTVSGYATPIRNRAGKVVEFLVTPTTAMCSHSSAPPSLQVVHVNSNGEHAPQEPGTPVIVSGSLIAETKTTPYLTGNRVLSVTSAYKLIPRDIQIVRSTKRSSIK